MKIEARPYLLKNQIQHYAWGSRGEAAYIPRLLGLNPMAGQSYAELWIGAHPKAPSSIQIEGKNHALDALIAQFPQAMLGKRMAEKHDNQLPFLLKVLSAGAPLSIQAHPNKAQAERLHRLDPAHYPDDNHKPEIAVALDSLTALAGLKTASAIKTLLALYTEIAAFIDYNGGAVDVRVLFTELLQRSVSEPDRLQSAIDALALRLESQDALSEAEQLFLNQRRIYTDSDVGLFALFFLNLRHLKKGEALSLDAGIPHAYLKGNIIECMANSDNVVRVGLTPKFKDVDSLVEIMDCRPEQAQIQRGTQGDNPIVYQAAVDEFVVEKWTVAAERPVEIKTRNRIEVLLVVSGQIQLNWSEGESVDQTIYSQGEAVLIPALMDAYQITSEVYSEVFRVRLP